LALAAGIKGGYPDQAVNPGFHFHEPIAVDPGHPQGDPFDAGFIAGLEVDELVFESFFIHPPCIHAQQHFSPVLGICSTGSGIDGNKGIPGIIFAIQGDFDGEFLDFFFEYGQKLGDFFLAVLIFLFKGEFQENVCVFNLFVNVFPGFQKV
jgi:hypothetical protein